ncbi:unnamed protein product [Ilex paraguariensis]|uniref:Uncharacterized protein n=1 Tax=Ilex paraguariensis TaxID=185542 RepID=A0ABC8TZM6_9AQUA
MEKEKGKEQIVPENIPEEEEVGQKVNEVVLDHKHGVDGNINLESIGTEKSTCNMKSVGLIQTQDRKQKRSPKKIRVQKTRKLKVHKKNYKKSMTRKEKQKWIIKQSLRKSNGNEDGIIWIVFALFMFCSVGFLRIPAGLLLPFVWSHSAGLLLLSPGAAQQGFSRFSCSWFSAGFPAGFSVFQLGFQLVSCPFAPLAGSLVLGLQ